jgi:chaperone BCS1
MEVADQAHLRKLFRRPSAGDVLLIEDIDSAGLKREEMVPRTYQDGNDRDHHGEDERSKQDEKKVDITIQGLFSTIHTARNEGVILIMTTNKPETLDPALVRPGLIDKNVHFGCATKGVAQRIFTRM